MVDSLVEGQVAVKDLFDSVKTMRKQKIDALVIIRGGGSIESLQAFNNEALVRAVADFPVPVIAGIGHDKDVPLLALAADVMASTPTAAAHIFNQSWEEAYAKVRQVPYLLNRIANKLKRVRADFDMAWASIIDHAAGKIGILKDRIASMERIARSNDPIRQLKIGYAIVRHNGKILRSVQKVDIGEKITTELSDGAIESKIEKINE